MEIICQRIPDRPTVLRHWKHASPRALVSLWRGTISSLWQTDRRCLREAGSATNGHKSPTQKDTAESSGIHAPLILVQNMILYCSARSLRCWWFCPTDALTLLVRNAGLASATSFVAKCIKSLAGGMCHLWSARPPFQLSGFLLSPPSYHCSQRPVTPGFGQTHGLRIESFANCNP